MTTPLLLAPLNGSLQARDRVNPFFSLTGSGAVRYGPAPNDGTLEDPALLAARGNSLAMVDRGSGGSLTATGAVRYQVGPGGRVNSIRNPRAASNTNGWTYYPGSGAASPGSIASDPTQNPFGAGSALKVAFTSLDFADPGVLVSNGGSGTTAGHQLRITPGVVYRYQMWVWTDVPGQIKLGINTVSELLDGTSLNTHTVVNQTTVTATSPANPQLISGTKAGQANKAIESIQLVLKSVANDGVAGNLWIIGMVTVDTGADTPYFDGASSAHAAWLDPLTGAPGTAHASPSTDRAALWIEEATTNNVTNPRAEVDLTGWVQWGTGTLTRDTSFAYIGPASIKQVTGAAGSGVLWNPMTQAATQGQTVTVSAWVRGTAGQTLNAGVWETTSGGAGIVTNMTGSVALSDSWQRVVAVVTMTQATAAYARPLFYTPNSGTTFYLANVQIEQKGYATSYADGSLSDAHNSGGAGYTWAGTAHASASSRATADTNVTETGHIDSNRGAVTFWYKRDYDNGIRSHVLSVGAQAAAQDQLSIYIENNDKLTADWRISAGSAQIAAWGSNDVPGTWGFGYVEWNGTTFALSVNGGAKVTGTRSTPNTLESSQVLHVGSNTSGTGQIDGFLYGLQTFDQPLTDADVTVLYNGGTPPATFGLGVFTNYPKPVRWNLVRNPRAANDLTGWTANGGTIARVTDDPQAVHGTCIEVTSTASTNTGMTMMPVGSARLRAMVPHVISFDVWYVSGGSGWKANAYIADAAGAFLFNTTMANFTPGATRQRLSYIYTPVTAGAHFLTLQLWTTTAAVSVLRVSDVVVEEATWFPAGAVPSYFDGSTGGAWLDPITGMLGTAHASPSVSRAALWVEEGTTNAITNPSFETNATDWNALGSTTLSRDTTYAALGAASLKIVSGNVAAGEGAYFAINKAAAANGQNWTGQLRFRGSGTWLLRVAEYDATPAFLAQSTVQVTATDQWQTVSLSRLLNQATTAWVTILFSTPTQQASTCWIDCVQLEQKAYATSYCDGSLGTGYSWSGTAHASSSTRAAVTISVDEPNHIKPDAGAIFFRASRQNNVVNPARLVNAGPSGVAGKQYIALEIANQYPRLGNRSGTAAQTNLNATNGGTVPTDLVIPYYADWNGTAVSARNPAGVIETGTRDAPGTDIDGPGLFIGNASGAGQPDGLFCDVVIFDRPLTASERAKLLADPATDWYTVEPSGSISGDMSLIPVLVGTITPGQVVTGTPSYDDVISGSPSTGGVLSG